MFNVECARGIVRLTTLKRLSVSVAPLLHRETAGWFRAQALENQIIEHLFLTSWKVNGGGGGRFNDKHTVTVVLPPPVPLPPP